MLASYLAAASLVAASVVVGAAVFALAGLDHRSLVAPAAGLATVLLICAISIELPGHATTAAVVLALVTVCAGAWLLRRDHSRVPRMAIATILLPVLLYAVPFVANGRVGLPGISVDNDLAVHLLWAAGLQNHAIALLYPPNPGYPLGPHSLVAALATLFGIGLSPAFTGLLIAVAPLTALSAAAVFPDLAAWRRVLIGLVVSTAYMLAAFYGEGSFKEPMMAMFLLAFVLTVRELRVNATRTRQLLVSRAAIPLALLAAAAVNSFSWIALGWFGAFTAGWMGLELLGSPSLLLERRRIVGLAQILAIVAVAAVVLFVIVDLPLASRLITYAKATGVTPKAGFAIPTSNVGNTPYPISLYAGLGLWFEGNFLLPPGTAFQAGELAAVGVAAALFGAVWALRRREFALLAAAIACALIYWYSVRTQSSYVAAKALVIGTPFVVLLGIGALLSRDGNLSLPLASLRLLLGLAFAFLALYSSYTVLRASQVAAPAQADELAQFRATIGTAPALFLGDDDFVGSELEGARLGYVVVSTVLPPPIAVAPSSKPAVYGAAFDFDSVTSAELDAFDYVITTSTTYASQPPANFHLVKALKLYELWRRSGPTSPRLNIDAAGAPGAVLTCSTRSGARIAHERGVAAVMTAPVVLNPGAEIAPNGTASFALALPPGRWAVSLDYTSPENLDVTLGGAATVMPANLGRPGPYFNIGTVVGRGVRHPIVVGMYYQHPSRLTPASDLASIISFAATREPNTREMVPLSRACGRYVDWYRLG